MQARRRVNAVTFGNWKEAMTTATTNDYREMIWSSIHDLAGQWRVTSWAQLIHSPNLAQFTISRPPCSRCLQHLDLQDIHLHATLQQGWVPHYSPPSVVPCTCAVTTRSPFQPQSLSNFHRTHLAGAMPRLVNLRPHTIVEEPSALVPRRCSHLGQS